jgi:hypothetical protein
MESKKSSFSAESLLIGGLLLLALLVTAVAITPNWRQGVRDFFLPEQRMILAKVSGDLTGQGLHVMVLKIQMRDTLVLEVYNVEKPEESTLMARIVLPEKRDAYFQLKGNATNLGLADVDNDGTLEIIAPAFDDQMIARLNIYKYNSGTHSFDRLNAPPGTEF